LLWRLTLRDGVRLELGILVADRLDAVAATRNDQHVSAIFEVVEGELPRRRQRNTDEERTLQQRG
jgi:hypothetical protein